LLAKLDSVPPVGDAIATSENTSAAELKHLAVQPADAWHSFIMWSAGIDAWSQQSCADATTTSEAID